MTASIIVYDVILNTKSQEFFTGRSEAQYGVGESISLTYTTQPANISVDLRWNIISGNGSIASASWLAGQYATNTSLRAWVNDGPSSDEYRDVSRGVVEPSSASMVQEPGSGIRHTTNVAGVGFHGFIYLTPKDVSFSAIEVREGTGVAVATKDVGGSNIHGDGVFVNEQDRHHEPSIWAGVHHGNISTGCRTYLWDKVDSGDRTTPYPATGTEDALEWAIQWEWRIYGGTPKPLAVFTHYVTINDAGTMMVTKGGAGPFYRAVGAATTTVHSSPDYQHPQE